MCGAPTAAIRKLEHTTASCKLGWAVTPHRKVPWIPAIQGANIKTRGIFSQHLNAHDQLLTKSRDADHNGASCLERIISSCTQHNFPGKSRKSSMLSCFKVLRKTVVRISRCLAPRLLKIYWLLTRLSGCCWWVHIYCMRLLVRWETC